jgi:S1-C subfamily serine protease
MARDRGFIFGAVLPKVPEGIRLQSGLLAFCKLALQFNRATAGDPLLDNAGQVVGMVAAKLNALKFVKATGNIPENINFAIKTGALRDFLDNSVVSYQTADSKSELKTSDIARNARAFTVLISCTVAEQSASAKKH